MQFFHKGRDMRVQIVKSEITKKGSRWSPEKLL